MVRTKKVYGSRLEAMEAENQAKEHAARARRNGVGYARTKVKAGTAAMRQSPAVDAILSAAAEAAGEE